MQRTDQPFTPAGSAWRVATPYLAAVNAVLLLMGLLSLSVQPDPAASGAIGSSATTSTAPTTTTSPPTATTAPASTPSTAPAVPAPAPAPTPVVLPARVEAPPASTTTTTAAPAPAPAPAPAQQYGATVSSRDAVLDGHARSVAVEGDVSTGDMVELSGSVQLGVEGDVTDATGATHSGVILEVRGDLVTVTGAVALVGDPVLVRPHDGSLLAPAHTPDPDPFWTHTGVELGSGDTTITGSEYRYQTADGWASIPGPVTVRAETFFEPDVGVWGGEVKWVNPPAAIEASATRLSWAGGGTITVGDHAFSHEYLGIDPPGYPSFTLERTGTEVSVRGQARVHMVYADGWPQIATTAGVTNHTPEVTVQPGGREWLTWVPRNEGNDFDMTMTRFRPDSEAATWVNLALGKLPDMDGGENQPRRGGDASGFGSRGSGIPFAGGAKEIWPMIGPGKGDSKNLSLDVPSDTPPGDYRILITIEGNFAPVTYEAIVHVVS